MKLSGGWKDCYNGTLAIAIGDDTITAGSVILGQSTGCFAEMFGCEYGRVDVGEFPTLTQWLDIF
jgi:hypothetical protein